MGLGQAFAAGMQSYNNQINTNQNRDLANKRDARADMVFEQNTELRKAQTELAQAKHQEYTSPEAKKLRADTYKLKSAEIANETGRLEISQQYNQFMMETKKKVEGLEKNNTRQKTDSIFTDYYTSQKDGAKPDLKGLNEIRTSNDLMKQTYPNPLIVFNPSDEKHVAGLKEQAKILVGAGGGEESPEALDAAYPAVEEMAKAGVFVFDSATGKLVNTDMMANVLGVNKRVSSHTVSGAKETVTKSATEATGAYGKKQQRQQQKANDRIQPPVMETYGGKDPQEVANWAIASGNKVDPEVQAMIDSNNEKSKEFEEMRTQNFVDDMLDKAKDGEITQNELSKLKISIRDMPKAEQTELRKEIDAAEDIITVNEVYEKDQADRGDLNTFKNIELENTDGNAKLTDVQQDIGKRTEVVAGINDILGRLEQVQDKMLTGLGAKYMVSGAATDLAGTEKLIAMAGGKPIPKEVLLNSIEMNTEIGRLVSDYVKMTSGASVTNEEYDRLSLVIAGAQSGDPAAMARAMQTFRDGTVRSLNRQKDTDVVKYKLPATGYMLKDIDDQKDYASDIQSRGSSIFEGAEEKPNTSADTQNSNPTSAEAATQYQKDVEKLDSIRAKYPNMRF